MEYSGYSMPFREHRVLIAEDESLLANLLVQAFNDSGYRTTVAANGIECMNKLTGFRPDVVIMDIMMPKLDGIDATRLIRRNPAFTKTVIVALTAKTDTGTRSEMLAAGADIFMAKPFGVFNLLETVNELLLARTGLNGQKGKGR